MFSLCSSSSAPFSCQPHRSTAENRVHGEDLCSPIQSFAPSVSACLFCGRRRFIGAASATVFLPIRPSHAAYDSTLNNKDAMNRIRPPNPDWYDEMFARAMDATMKTYEAGIAGYKTQLFAELKGKANEVLELGIGTGPNLKYYAGERGFAEGFHLIGVDPNANMEKYARAAATSAGLLSEIFDFRQAVGEALPLADASVDVVIGTLVLCSVRDVNRTLSEIKRVLKPGGLYFFIEHVAAKDGTFLRICQSLLDPLQQVLADGCHLTRNTGQSISQAGFSQINISSIFLSSASLLGPHVYGIAQR